MDNPGARISLLDVEPDLARFMSADEQAEAATVSLPVTRLPRGAVDLEALLGRNGVFGALVLDGMLFSHHRVGEQTALRLLGPGDLLAVPGAGASTMLPQSVLSATAPVTMALFGTEVLLAARRWPRIVAGFHVRIAEQSDRVAAQLTICQFPRVDQRLLAMMWLLAESWGQVTSAGTRVPLNLTHDAFGALVGARRPTVTLALGQLMERGAIVRQDRGWLLLEAPVEVLQPPPAHPEHEVLIDEPQSAWKGTDTAAPSSEELHEQLLVTVKRLRAEHLATRDRVRSRLAELAEVRARTSAARDRRADEALRRREAPS
jgi:CRP/FNR family transcriptional regulator, cyclic AMP receptor protein